jgi:formylglycine-generating enzyme required for sulfatase activity
MESFPVSVRTIVLLFCLVAACVLALSLVSMQPTTSAPEGVTALTLDRERALSPKDTFRECDKCPDMVVIPAGLLFMGSPDSEILRFSDEGPPHTVTFEKPFAVGEYPVTFDEWDACVADGGCQGYKPFDEGWGRGRHPVINVSWNDASDYVDWLSAKTGMAYRLLSEAEREYVTRAGNRTPFWWGGTISPEQANYDGNYAYGTGPKGEYRQRTLPVGSFDANPWGVYGVHGNVWEWTQDCWHVNYSGAPTDGSAWTDGNCNIRILRGGAWADSPRMLRAAKRFWHAIEYRDSTIGFRVARTLAP